MGEVKEIFNMKTKNYSFEVSIHPIKGTTIFCFTHSKSSNGGTWENLEDYIENNLSDFLNSLNGGSYEPLIEDIEMIKKALVKCGFVNSETF